MSKTEGSLNMEDDLLALQTDLANRAGEIFRRLDRQGMPPSEIIAIGHLILLMGLVRLPMAEKMQFINGYPDVFVSEVKDLFGGAA